MALKYGKVGDRLRDKLKKFSYIKHPGKTSTFLLDVFVFHGGYMKADQAVAQELCEENGFKKWRDALIADGFLAPWSHEDRSKHKCGTRILKDVNDAKILASELATKTELDKLATKEDLERLATKDEFRRLESEVDELSKAVDRVLNIIDPPADDDKRTKFRKGGYDKHLSVMKN
jgi:hypothetical protein